MAQCCPFCIIMYYNMTPCPEKIAHLYCSIADMVIPILALSLEKKANSNDENIFQYLERNIVKHSHGGKK